MSRVARAPSVLLVAALAAAAGLIAYWPLLSDGGFAVDDWAQAARSNVPSAGHGGLGGTLDVTGSRLGNGLLQYANFAVLGTHYTAHYVLALTWGVLVVCLFYLVLREYGMPAVPAAAAAVLAQVLPAGAIAREWITVSAAQAGIAFFLAGLLVALRALKTDDRRLHAVSLGFYVLAVFELELAVPWVGLSVLWYLPRAGTGAALRRWVWDLAVCALAVVAALVFPAPAQEFTKAGDWPSRVSDLAGGVLRTLWDSLTAYAAPVSPWLALLLLAAVLAAATRSVSRETQIGAGVCIAALVAAYSVYVPGNPFLLPDLPGPRGRTNVAAGLPISALLVLVAAGVGSLLPRAAGRAAAVTICGVLLAGAIVQTRQESRAWADAAVRERGVLDKVARAVPDPARDGVLLAAGSPGAVTVSRASRDGSITVFNEPFVTTAAARVRYDRSDVFALALIPEDELACGPAALVVRRPGYPDPLVDVQERSKSPYGLSAEFHRPGSLYNVPGGRYGRIDLVDVRSGRTWRPADAAQCRAAVASLRGE